MVKINRVDFIALACFDIYILDNTVGVAHCSVVFDIHSVPVFIPVRSNLENELFYIAFGLAVLLGDAPGLNHCLVFCNTRIIILISRP